MPAASLLAHYPMLTQSRAYFRTGATLDVEFRIRQLKKLKAAVIANEAAIIAALKADLGKPTIEAFGAEVGLVLSEISHVLSRLRGWARPRRAALSLPQWPSTGWVYPEPYGVVLILVPWNYPFLLALAPLVNALAAGNCAVVKPSEVAPNSSAVLARLLRETFEPAYVNVVGGGAETAQALLDQPFDYIFYTGNATVGKLVMQAAAKNLTPVTLELGGKSPVIIDASANISRAARRVAFGKCYNAGQSCVAPDYALVQRDLVPAFIHALKLNFQAMYGDDPQRSPDFGRIINDRHFRRICSLMRDGTIAHGGQTDASDRYIAPTLITDAPDTSGLMQEEIFGPLLPIVPFDTLDQAFESVLARPKPLAAYLFSHNRLAQKRFLRELSFGGGMINDVLTHFMEPSLPFGGVGNSGIGSYRGKTGFETFSHFKGVIHKSDLAQELWVRVPPYQDLKLKLFRLFLR